MDQPPAPAPAPPPIPPEAFPCPELPRIPGTPYPDLRVQDPPPPKDGGADLRPLGPGQSPMKRWLADDQVGRPRPAVGAVTKPAPRPAE